jgi:hypothetical protein
MSITANSKITVVMDGLGGVSILRFLINICISMKQGHLAIFVGSLIIIIRSGTIRGYASCVYCIIPPYSMYMRIHKTTTQILHFPLFLITHLPHITL